MVADPVPAISTQRGPLPNAQNPRQQPSLPAGSRGETSSSGESSLGISAHTQCASAPEALRRKRNRPRSRNRPAFLRHQTCGQEVGGVSSPIVQEGETEEGEISSPIDQECGTAGLEEHSIPVSPAFHRLPVIREENCGPPSLKRRGLARSPSVSKETHCDITPGSSYEAGFLGADLGEAGGSTVIVDNGTKRKRSRGVEGPASSLRSNSEFSLESSRLFKRHLRFAALESKSWDFSPEGESKQHVDSENYKLQRKGAGLAPEKGECSFFC